MEHHRDDRRLLRLMMEEGPRSDALMTQIGELRVYLTGPDVTRSLERSREAGGRSG